MPQPGREGNCKTVKIVAATICRVIADLEQNPTVIFDPHMTEKMIAERDFQEVIIMAVRVEDKKASVILDDNFEEIVGFDYKKTKQFACIVEVIPVIEKGFKGKLTQLLTKN